ncbi:MAG: RIP metalloprotease RseP [Gammaproteobacteria bacterium]|nr:RIP metalloprotease RseP [Gammaproteobacteria bacterium]
MGIAHNLLFFIIAIAILIAFHEFGHYWVARKLGVRVLRFSIGFGKPLYTWTRTINGHVIEYIIAAIPLGGYVKMLDQREGEVAEDQLPYAFNTQPLKVRAAIVAAGPVFNLALAVLLYWTVFLSGITVERALLGVPIEHSIAATSGFQDNDEVIKVGENPVKSWADFHLLVLDQGLDGGKLNVQVKNIDGVIENRLLDLGKKQLLEKESDIMAELGFRHWWPDIPAKIGGVIKDSPAERAGLQEGDQLLQLDGDNIQRWDELVKRVENSQGVPIEFSVLRDQQEISIVVIPGERKKQGESKGFIGAYQEIPDELTDKLFIDIEYGVFGAIPAAFAKTWDMAKLTLRVIWKMIVGEASLSNISGPVTIAKYAGETAGIGLTTFIGFLAIISVSLGVLNLLPIPVLDGGHLFYYLIEAIKGSPVSEEFELRGQQIGVVILATLMFIAFYNDFQRFAQ